MLIAPRESCLQATPKRIAPFELHPEGLWAGRAAGLILAASENNGGKPMRGVGDCCVSSASRVSRLGQWS
jgi:hypothetical protein